MSTHSQRADARTVTVQGVTLHLAQPMTMTQDWIGNREILKQLLACWLVIDERDLPLSPRITGQPGIGKTTLAMAAPASASRTSTCFNARRIPVPKTCW
ncbi:MAG: hypothetical protein UZ03_NOB001002680 [Nitrospira sp. OLB3]|nr:MAG: hypothetical protein UZ03_NOB001002680 [Nitrospira sp. OLB3]